MSILHAEAPVTGIDADVTLAKALIELMRSLVHDEVERVASRSGTRPRALSIKEVVEATSLSRSTLMRMERRGELRFIRVGRRVLLPADEVERLIGQGVER